MTSVRSGVNSLSVTSPVCFHKTSGWLVLLWFTAACLPALGQNAIPESGTARAQTTQSRIREAWHRSMSRTPLPKKGCFKATYPSTEWQEVPCTTPPSFPLRRMRGRGRESDPNVVGGGSNDVTAQVAGFISTAEGSFISVNNGISETGTDPNTGKTTADTYTLQLNTNTDRKRAV